VCKETVLIARFVAVVDAMIMPGMLRSASLKLWKNWNWWLPRKLHGLPRLSLEGEPAMAEA
jgi:uncharacterized membrane protein YdfJ with MMPL/SSD domain